MKPLVDSEQKLFFILHLVGPFLQRLHTEKTRSLNQLTVELYELLLRVDQHSPNLTMVDNVCDLLYPLLHECSRV